jgi:hypothetical protein
MKRNATDLCGQCLCAAGKSEGKTKCHDTHDKACHFALKDAILVP